MKVANAYAALASNHFGSVRSRHLTFGLSERGNCAALGVGKQRKGNEYFRVPTIFLSVKCEPAAVENFSRPAKTWSV